MKKLKHEADIFAADFGEFIITPLGNILAIEQITA